MIYIYCVVLKHSKIYWANVVSIQFQVHLEMYYTYGKLGTLASLCCFDELCYSLIDIKCCVDS